MHQPDLVAAERRLIEATIEGIRAFSKEHRNECFSYFAYDCNPHSGLILLCLDTSDNSRAMARKHEKDVTERRHRLAGSDLPDDRQWAFDFVRNSVTGPVLPFCNNTGNFKYQGFGDDVEFEDWPDFCFSSTYPGKYEESGEDYLQCQLVVLFSRVIDELVARNAFACLKLASPFYIGFAFQDSEQFVVRIINW